jgi:hypothetical protein
MVLQRDAEGERRPGSVVLESGLGLQRLLQVRELRLR